MKKLKSDVFKVKPEFQMPISLALFGIDTG